MGKKRDIQRLTERVRALEQGHITNVGGILSGLDLRVGRLESIEPPPEPPASKARRETVKGLVNAEALDAIETIKEAVQRASDQRCGRSCRECDYWLNCYPGANQIGRCRLFSNNLNHKQLLTIESGLRVRCEIVTRHDFYCNEYQPRKVDI